MFDNFLGYIQRGVEREKSIRSSSKKSYGHINNYNKEASKYNESVANKEHERNLELAEASRPIINITLTNSDGTASQHLSEEELEILAEKIVNKVEKNYLNNK